VSKYLKISRKNYRHFSVILALPDLFNRVHTRALYDLLLCKMGFDSVFAQQESVLASYAMGT
jgi:actin-related protein 8